MLKVADLFCGPGGISEGFRLAGFKIVYGLDKDNAAVRTFQNNHPRAVVEKKDASNFDPNDIPEFDILVGGPPCVNFSTSKGGRANVLEGLRLVQAFLRVVYERSPKYWIMENVPRVALHLPESIPLRWIGIDKSGELEIPLREEFNVADYGVPQARRRYLVGNYPMPIQTHCDPEKDTLFFQSNGLKRWKTLKHVIDAFPDPLCTIDQGLIIKDPNFDIELSAKLFMDHFYDSTLDEDEARRIKRVKVEHPFMGRMSFPDDLDKPARTVVATQLGRETLVIRCSNRGNRQFRRLTVRECATLQSFPITYQFFGNSLNSRYRLAGDAVPPILTYAIGREILKLEGIHNNKKQSIIETPIKLSSPVKFAKRKKRKIVLPELKKFSRMVPGKEVRGCRVDFDNQGSEPSKSTMIKGEMLNLVEWSSTLFVGEGKKNLRKKKFTVEESLWEFAGVSLFNCTEDEKSAVHLLDESYKKFLGKLPDATTLQAIWTRRATGEYGPHHIADQIGELVSKYFPKNRYKDLKIPKSGRFEIVPRTGLRIRIAAALIVTSLVCEIINNDSRWIQENTNNRYIPEGWEVDKRRGHKYNVANPATRYTVILERRRAHLNEDVWSSTSGLSDS